jgi:murein tripeptide amidase MpaA
MICRDLPRRYLSFEGAEQPLLRQSCISAWKALSSHCLASRASMRLSLEGAEQPLLRRDRTVVAQKSSPVSASKALSSHCCKGAEQPLLQRR